MMDLKEYENLFENLEHHGLLTICAWCRTNKNRFNILDYKPHALIKGVSHGICEKCLGEMMAQVSGSI